MTDLTQPRPSTNDIRPEPAQNADRAGLLPTLWRRLCGAWRMALDEEHLTALDDRMLRDLGITRHQIRIAVRSGRPLGAIEAGRWPSAEISPAVRERFVRGRGPGGLISLHRVQRRTPNRCRGARPAE
jgi:uncharacterized protein YjiS (DUF1127 family)